MARLSDLDTIPLVIEVLGAAVQQRSRGPTRAGETSSVAGGRKDIARLLADHRTLVDAIATGQGSAAFAAGGHGPAKR